MLPDFRLETRFSKWEFEARYHMTASDAESMSMRELLAMATPEKPLQLFLMNMTQRLLLADSSPSRRCFSSQSADRFRLMQPVELDPIRHCLYGRV